MTCKPEGTHHNACDCREEALAAEIAALKARAEGAEKALGAVVSWCENSMNLGQAVVGVRSIYNKALGK